MSDDDVIMEGTIIDQFSGGVCDVQISEGMVKRCKISGRMDHHDIDVTVGDTVKVKFHDTDMQTGLIVRRVDNDE